MIFDAHFSMREWPHFFAGFCHQSVVLCAAFFDAWFTSSWAKRGEIPCDGQEHVIYHGIDCFWFLFHTAHCKRGRALIVDISFHFSRCV
jgi:hypothetical protein